MTIRKRDGTPLLLDAPDAIRNFRYAAAEVGHVILFLSTLLG